MSLIPLQIRYQFDPSGDNVANLVTGEIHEIPPINRRIIVPRMGAYYARSLRIRNQQRDLVLNQDYYLAGFFQDATEATGQDVNVLIYFEGHIQGEVELTYQVVGGNYVGIFETIQDYVNALLVDPRNVKWDDILNKPELFVPMEHFHDINDVYGLNYLIPKLEEIRLAIMRVRSKEMRKVYDRILRIRNDVDKISAQTNRLLGENRTLTTEIQAEVNLIKSNLVTLGSELTALRNDPTVANKLRKLETDINQLKANDNTFDNQLRDAISRIDAFNTKATDYDAMLRKFNTLVNNTTGKLAKAAYNISTDKSNILSVDNNGVLSAIPHRYKYPDNPNIPYTDIYYVDAVNGDNNNVGDSKTYPFRTIAKALSVVKPGVKALVYLLENQTHEMSPIIPVKIVDNSISFYPYSKTDKPVADILRSSIQFGNGTTALKQNTTNNHTNVCISMFGDTTISFNNIHLDIFTGLGTIQNTFVYPSDKGIFKLIDENTKLNLLIDHDCKITFRNSHDRLIADTLSSRNIVLDLDVNLFNTENNITGPGKISDDINNKCTIHFINLGVKDHTYTPTNTSVIARITKYLPQLKRTFNSIYGSISANIDPSILPWKNTNELTDLTNTIFSNLPTNTLTNLINTGNDNILTVRDGKLFVPIANDTNKVGVVRRDNADAVTVKDNAIIHGSLATNVITDSSNVNIIGASSADYTGINLYSNVDNGQHTQLLSFGPYNHVIRTLEDINTNTYINERILTNDNAHLHLKLDPKATNLLTKSSNGLLAETKLSRESGNLLSIRSDGGIYYGITPPPNISMLYVDAEQGSDTSGNGTRNSPYATIKKAVEISSDLAPRTVRIMEGQNHIVDKGLNIKNLGILITPYGPQSDTAPQPIGDTKFVLKSIYNLNTRITFIPHGRKRANYPYIDMVCIKNVSGYSTKLDINAIKIIIGEHPDQAIVGAPTDYNPSMKYMVSSENCIFSTWGYPIDSWFYNCGLEFPTNPDALKVSLLPSDNSRLGTFTCRLDLNELSGEFPIYNATNDIGKVTVYLHGIHGKSIDTLIPNTETFVKYFPNTYIDSNLKTTPSNIIGVNRNKIPLLSSIITKDAIDFVTSIDNNGTSTSSTTAKKGKLSYTHDEHFKFNKPLVNSDNQLLKVSPDTGNKLISKSNGLFVQAPTLTDMVSPNTGNALSIVNDKLFVAQPTPTQPKVSAESGNIITIKPDGGLYANVPASQNTSIDFTTLDNLPEKPYTHSTVILGRDRNGAWHKAVTDFYKEMVVKLSSDRPGVFKNNKFRVTCTVGYVGKVYSGKTVLTISLPQKTNDFSYDLSDTFALSNASTSISGGGNYRLVAPGVWYITGLTPDSVFTTHFDVTPHTLGEFKINVHANTESGARLETSNDFITVHVGNPKIPEGRITPYYGNCGAVYVSNLANNKRLTGVRTKLDEDGNIIPDNRYWKESINKLEVESLAGVRIKLENIGRVMCKIGGVRHNRERDNFNYDGGINKYPGVDNSQYVPIRNTDGVYYTSRLDENSPDFNFYYDYSNNNRVKTVDGRVVGQYVLDKNDMRLWSLILNTEKEIDNYNPFDIKHLISMDKLNPDAMVLDDNLADDTLYTFDPNTKILTFANDTKLKTAVIACKDNSRDCPWHLYILSTYEDIVGSAREFEVVNNSVQNPLSPNQIIIENNHIEYYDYKERLYPSGEFYIGSSINAMYIPPAKVMTGKVTINLSVGQVSDFTIRGYTSSLYIPPTQGSNITFTRSGDDLRVRTNSKLNIADSINLGTVKINVG